MYNSFFRESAGSDTEVAICSCWILCGQHDKFGKLLLVSPSSHSCGLKTARRGRAWDVNLGLLSLTTFLLQDGWRFEGAKKLSLEDIRLLIDTNTDVGISVQLNNYLTGIEVANAAKDVGARRVIMGGPYPSSRAEQILINQGNIDFVISGAGEAPLASLLRNNKVSSINGLAYRDTTGMVKYNTRDYFPINERPVPLRSLWPERLDQKLFGKPCINVYFKDGCSVALREPCVFCTIDHPGCSRRTVDQIMEEMKQLSALGFEALEEGGDDFCAGGERGLEWINDIAERMQHEDLSFSWLIHTTAKTLTYPNMIEALARLGVKIIQIGFESGDERFKIKFKTNAQWEKSIVQKLEDTSMKIYGSWIMGLPGETNESLHRTLDEIQRLYETGLLCGMNLDPLWAGPGSRAFEMLCDRYPELSSMDYIHPMELVQLWFKNFTQIDLDKALDLRSEIIKKLNLPIVGGMLL